MASQQRDLRINLSANAAGLERGLDRAGKAMEKYRRSVEDAQNAVARLEKELQDDMDRALAEVEDRAQARADNLARAGQSMLVAGAAMGAGLAMSAKAAIQWESDWAGVTKVLDATPEQVARLEQQFRDLATVLPVTHSEVAEVASAAAQLGVATEHLVGFTETAIQLGVATNLSSQDAAMGLARLSTVMGVSFGDISRMGSSLVALGNNFAAMEDEILEMSLRLSGMGNQIGLTSGQVMGLAAGFAAVGIQAELGGGAFSRALGRIQISVQQGGKSLEDLANVAGMSAQEFADAFQNRPNEAIVAFLKGLDQVNQTGGSVAGTLGRLGLTGTEIADVMGRASAAWETVADAMEVGNEGFEDGNALLEEAAARFETTESRVAMAKNAINDLAIDVGNNFLPVIGDAAESVSAWTAYIQGMPEPVKEAGAVVSTVGAAAAVAGGAFLMAVPKVAEFRTALDTMGPRTQAVGRGLGNIMSILGGPWGLALGAAVAVGAVWMNQQAEIAARQTTLAQALMISNGALDANVRMTAAKTLQDEGVLDLARKLGLDLQLVTDAYLGNTGAAAQLNSELQRLGDEGTTVEDTLLGTRTYLDENGLAAQTLANKMEGLSGDFAQATGEARNLEDASGGTAEALLGAEGAATGLQGGLDGVATGAMDAAGQVRNLKAELDALTQSNVDATQAEISFLDAIHRATEGIETNGATLDINTDAGRRNMENLIGLRDRANDYTSSIWETTGSVDATIEAHERGRAEFIKAAREMGATASEAEDLADEYLGIPAEVKTAIEVDATGRWSTSPTQNHSHTSPRNGGAEFFAVGGAVSGPGGPTEDLIPAWLSNGEHVLTASEVQMLGGQERVYALRDLIRSGGLKFARGGAVGPLPKSAQIVNDHREDVRVNIQRLIAATTAGVASEMAQQWKRYMASGGAVVAAWRSALGTPYSWGGGGPGGPGYGFGRGAGIRGYDCSSLMQYGWARAGVHLPRTTYQQINYGSAVQRGHERPGDLVFPHRGHVAGYVGAGRLIHAPYTGARVSYRGMYPNPIAIRRPGRYDQGGRMEHGETGINLSRRPERVLSPRQTRSFERLVDVLSGTTVPAQAVGPTEVHYHVHHVPGFTTERDLQRAEQHRQQRVRAGRRR